MQVALLGEPQSGKSTLFCGLSGIDYAKHIASGARRAIAAVRVLDPRLLLIQEREGKHKKIVCPHLELMDTPPLFLEEQHQEKNKEVFAHLREAHGVLAILKLYEKGASSAEERRQLVKAQIQQIQEQLRQADIVILQARLERLQVQKQRPHQWKEEQEHELELVQLLLSAFQARKPDVASALKEEQKKRLASFQLLVQKPVRFLANLSETEAANGALYKDTIAFAFCLRLEHELMQMDEAERQSFMKEYNLRELSLAHFTLALYHSMGYKMFFTYGKNDVTGWEIPPGADAVTAAGKIHTDIERGFICAEVEKFEDWLAKKKVSKTEGRSYIVQDGDMINFKFNV